MRILTFLYLIYIAVAVSACGRHRNTTVTPARDHKYIVQLSPEVDIENFIPKLIQGAIGFVHNLIEEVGEGIEDLLGRTYDRTSTKKVHVTNTVDIGGGFKALTMDILDDRLLEPIITGFSEILGIFPDDEIQFQLPKPTKSNKDKRYYIRYDPVHSPQPKHAGIYAESEPEHEEGEQPVTTASPTTTATTARQKWPGWTSSISPNDPSTATKTSTLSHAATPTSSSSSNVSYTQQKDAPWNLVRISERDLDLDKPYIYDSQAGEGVIVYVVDDGIAIHNEDFEGRAKHGWTAFGNDTSRVVTSSSVKKAKSNPLDGGGHGTHVAGLIGGKTYGVAKRTQLVSVQVLSADGKGTVSNFLSGLQWILQQEKDRDRPVIINMSLGLPKSNPGANALDQAVTAAVKAGLPVIAAAGNSGSDACQITPAGNKKVYTVGTVTQDDEMDSYSCYGKCVNILAPGYDVTSTYIGAKDATATMSGSSMAAPHVSGVAALLLPRLQDPTPENLYQLLTDLATRDKISGLPDKQTPNALVFNGQQKTVQLPSSLLKKDGFLSSSTK